MSIYDFTVKAQDGSDVSLADYRDKVLLVVNTATGCGFTPQYKDLQAIYDEYHDQGLEILDFPCNQFGNQAPGTTRRSTPSAPAASASPSPSSPRSTCWAKTPIPSSGGCLPTPNLRASAAPWAS